MDHPVAVERIRVASERREFRVGSVAQIDALEVVGNVARDWEVRGAELVIHRREDAGEIGVGGWIDRLEGTVHGRRILRVAVVRPFWLK